MDPAASYQNAMQRLIQLQKTTNDPRVLQQAQADVNAASMALAQSRMVQPGKAAPHPSGGAGGGAQQPLVQPPNWMSALQGLMGGR